MEKLCVIGAGESGMGAALLAKEKGFDVFVTDFGSIKEEEKIILRKENIPFEEKGHSIEKLIEFNIFVKSPGVPEKATIIRKMRAENKRIISEIEFGYNYYNGIILAVTGSNGKTTTAGLLFHLLKSSNLNVGLGGNIGTSFCKRIMEQEYDYMVLELSSFQLDDIENFKPNISIIINITPDHLDRYNYNYEEYVNAKFQIVKNQTNDDLCILNADDETIALKLVDLKSEVRISKITKENYKDGILSKDGNSKYDLTLKGSHNLLNATLAMKAARALGLDESLLQKALMTFKNVEHRLESVAKINGVEFINDSKATNVDASFYGLGSVSNPLIWIAGGTDKGNDYTELISVVTGQVKMLICLGLDNEKLKKAFENHIPKIIETKDVIQAVHWAFEEAIEGDAVLLSPACASFDLFKNYEDRGNKFKNAVYQLLEK